MAGCAAQNGSVVVVLGAWEKDFCIVLEYGEFLVWDNCSLMCGLVLDSH